MLAPTSLRRLIFGPAVCLLLSVALIGCEDGSLNAPEIQESTSNTDLFASYVALGNSITAGFQSGGIIDSTQESSYAALLAEQMNTPFGIPRLAAPGCPPPYVEFFNTDGVPAPRRPQGTSDATCAFREAQIPERVNNVALPFAATADATSNETPRSSTYSQFFLGGRTQVEAALDANPTFATVWLGNNDILGPATQGSDAVTPDSAFQAEYTDMLDQLDQSVEGGVLIGVANVTFTPFFSPGTVYAGLKQQGRFPDNFNVASNCATGSPTPLVPLPYGFDLIGQAQADTTQTVTLDCAAANTGVLTSSEVQTLVQTVQNYNAFIEDQANDRGYAYFDPNATLLQPVYADTGNTAAPTDDPIPKFPNRTSDEPFGPFFSLDGVHPSSATHRLVADRLIDVINSEYDASLPAPQNVPQVP